VDLESQVPPDDTDVDAARSTVRCQDERCEPVTVVGGQISGEEVAPEVDLDPVAARLEAAVGAEPAEPGDVVERRPVIEGGEAAALFVVEG
jgi:hypothetical protein